MWTSTWGWTPSPPSTCVHLSLTPSPPPCGRHKWMAPYLMDYFVPRPLCTMARFNSNTLSIEPIQADCRASETGSSLEDVRFRKQTTPELDNPGDNPFYPRRANHCHPYG